MIPGREGSVTCKSGQARVDNHGFGRNKSTARRRSDACPLPVAAFRIRDGLAERGGQAIPAPDHAEPHSFVEDSASFP